jgi:hypothetical protein
MRPSMIEKPAPLPFVAKSRAAMGKKAAEDITYEVSRRLQDQQSVRMIFAAAPCQSEMLTSLVLMPDVDTFDRLPFAAVHLQDPISGLVPATALRTHSDWSLYLDEDSAADLASPEAL